MFCLKPCQHRNTYIWSGTLSLGTKEALYCDDLLKVHEQVSSLAPPTLNNKHGEQYEKIICNISRLIIYFY